MIRRSEVGRCWLSPLALAVGSSARAQATPYPAAFATQEITSDGTTIHVRVLGIGENSFGPMMARVMRAAAKDVTELIIPASGHWFMEEQPTATSDTIVAFRGRNKPTLGGVRPGSVSCASRFG